MGLLTRLKGEHKRSVLKELIPQHVRNNTLLLLLIYLDFSAAGLDLSCTLLESPMGVNGSLLDPRKTLRQLRGFDGDRIATMPKRLLTAVAPRPPSPESQYDDATPLWKPTVRQRQLYLGIDADPLDPTPPPPPPPPQSRRRRLLAFAPVTAPTTKNRANPRGEKTSSGRDRSKPATNSMEVDAELRRHISDYDRYLFADADDNLADGGAGADTSEAPVSPTAAPVPGPPTDLPLHLARQLSVGLSSLYDLIQLGALLKFKVSLKNSLSSLLAQPVAPPSLANAGAALRAAAVANTSQQADRLPDKLDAQTTGMLLRKLKQIGLMPMMQQYTGPQRPPMMAMNTMPMYDPYQHQPGLYASPMMLYLTEYFGSAYDQPGLRRALMTVADSARMRMLRSLVAPMPLLAAPTGGFMGGARQLRMAPQLTGGYGAMIPRIHDGTINRKIEEFCELRHYIACGNKLLEFRLRWVKMLVKAINYNLYSFINIKGEPILPDMVYHNRALFVKSAVTHLYKLMKEDQGKARFDVIRADVCYIHGCLLKQDYLTLYNEDYGIDKNIEGAVEMFEKALDTTPLDYRLLYKLGEIFEYEYPDEFDKALHYYKEAALLLYNRAILKVAMLYLNVPQIRLRRFIRYLLDLANIDIDDVKVKNDEDKDEVEDVIGLACYELGKIYEGIYPGDLTFEDPFIQQCLEVAPVNYAKALAYYNKLARLNCLYGLVKLGNIYEFGELNRPRNPLKLIAWYMKATLLPLAFKRHPDAMIGLLRWCLNGLGGSNRHIPFPNPQMATMWCDRAIKEFDSADAMYWMGELIEMGVAQGNPNEWYLKAYNLGHEDAARKLGLQPEYNGEGQYEPEDDEVEFSE